MTAAHVVHTPPIAPVVSALQAVLAPQNVGDPATQQFPGTQLPAQHSSPGLTEHCTSVAVTEEQPVAFATHVPWARLQMSPAVHCESSVHPPQTFGVVNPHDDVAPLQSAFELQFPGMQAPELHTYGVEPPP